MTDPTALQEITWPVDDPFFTGGAVEQREDLGQPCSINGRGFMLDLRDSLGINYRYQRTSINLLNTQQATSGGEQAQLPPEIWRRSVESWHSGAGQDNYDRSDSISSRYSDSRNVNPWDQWQISLLHDTALVQTLPAGRSFLSTVGASVLVAAAGVDLYWWPAGDLSVPPTHVINLGGAIASLCSDGQALYVLDVNGGVRKYTDAATSTSFATIASPQVGRQLVRYLKGFLVVANGRSLYDISTGTPVLIYTHPLSGFTWADACEGSVLAYLLGGVGDRWNVYGMQPKTDATTFDPPVSVAPIPDGEIAYAIASYLGYVLVGLSTGWRFGTTDTNGTVTMGRLITTGKPVLCFEGQDRFVWYGRSTDVGATAGLGRTDLATFTTPLTPAYAPDLTNDALDGGTVHSVVTFGLGTGLAKRVFSVDGVGVYTEVDQLAATGWLEQGEFTFNTSDQKMGLYSQTYYKPLVGEVDYGVSYDEGPVSDLATFSFGGAISAGKIGLNTLFNTIRVRYTLHRDDDDPTVGPVLTRSEVRVLPVAGRATEFRIPLVIRSAAHWSGGPQTRDVQSDLDLLYELVQSRQPFIYREAKRKYRLYANDFAWLPSHMTNSQATLEGTFVLVAREIG